MKTKIKFLVAALALMSIGMMACSRSHSNDSMSMAKTPVAYHCAMHPQIVSDKPGECPICHMQLIPFQNPSMNTASTMAAPTSGVAGQGMVAMSADVEQTIGVEVASVEEQSLSRHIRATARVALDPQLYNASVEHREALAFLKKAQAQGSPELQEEAQATVHSSELRLQQMGFSAADMEKDTSGPETSSLLIGSSHGELWVYAQIFEEDMPWVHRGQSVQMTTPALPGEVFTGNIVALDPTVDGETRTLRVRIHAHDPKGHLKPEMFLAADIEATLGKRLAVPTSAVLDTGARALVYVQTAPGRFSPREIRLGTQADPYTEVLSGVASGEKVATSANFLIDSESRINSVTEKALQSR